MFTFINQIFHDAYPGLSPLAMAWRFTIDLVGLVMFISIVPLTIIIYAMQIGGVE